MFSACDTQRAQVPEWSNGNPQVLLNILDSLTEVRLIYGKSMA